jgi:nitrite reductase/ring-hydroxylating ferredoxin subunit
VTRFRSAAFAVAVVALALGGVATAGATAADASLVFDGEDLTPAAGPNQTIQGHTNLSAGSTVSIRIVSDNASSPFLLPANATVTENGSFATQVDLSPVDPGTEFTVTVEHDGRELTNTTGTVVACDGGCDPVAPSTEHDGTNGTLLDEGEEPTLYAEPNQTISGRTALEPGTALTVRMQSSDTDSPFLLMQSTTVDDDGTFEATVDLSKVAGNTTVDILVHHNGTTLSETTGTVAPCRDNCTHQTVRTRAEGNGTSLVYEGDQPTVSADAGQTIAGRTDLPPGTNLSIRLKSDSPENPFLIPARATVTDYGTFETTVDLSALEPGGEFDITVSHEGTVLLETSGHIAECDENCSDRTATTTSAASQADVGGQGRSPLLGGGALVGAGVLGVAGIAALLGIVRP